MGITFVGQQQSRSIQGATMVFIAKRQRPVRPEIERSADSQQGLWAHMTHEHSEFCIVGEQLSPERSTRLMPCLHCIPGAAESTGLEKADHTTRKPPLSQRFSDLLANLELIGADSDQLHVTGFTESNGAIPH
ncbi:hypothetical protein KYE_02463, partial [Marinobacter manganoxydans MnI7-9]